MVRGVKPLSPEEARNLAETSALVARAGDLAVLRITGGDRLSWLAGLVTQDVAKLPEGGVAYTFLCEKKGKIVCDMHVFARPDALDLVVPAEAAEAVAAALDHHLIMEDVEIAASDAAVFRVYGPAAPALANALGGAAWPGASFRLPVAHVVAGTSDADTFAEQLAAATREHGAGVAPSGFEDGLRIALGIPRFGRDFGPAHYPQESSLHGLGVSFSKGCYLGQEVLYMLEHRGHAKRHVVRLSSEAEIPLAPLHEGDAEVGAVSSVARDGAGWAALGMVKAQVAAEGRVLVAGAARCVVHPLG